MHTRCTMPNEKLWLLSFLTLTLPLAAQETIQLAGKVRLDDGSIPSEPVPIERYCQGGAMVEGRTDRKGRFTLHLGGDLFSTALDTSLPIPRVSGGSGAVRTGSVPTLDGPGAGGGLFKGCEIRAVLFGYRSDAVQLHDRDVTWRPDVGVITLHRLKGVRGRSTSPTSLNASPTARERYEKGLKELAKAPDRRKLDKAGQALGKAVAEYPQYAAAWTALGKVRAATGNADGAQNAFQASIEADSDYMYQPLILLEMSQRRWRQVFDLSEKLLQLHEDLPHVGYYQAKASYFLGDLDSAETLSREVLSSAGGENLPEAHQLLGMVFAKKGQFQMAANEYRAVVAARPNSDTAALLTKQLQVWEAKGLLAEQTAGR